MSGAIAARPASEAWSTNYRRALGRFPTGVAFAAARAPDGRPVGLLINSFTSVSLEPPLVMWCLALNARSRAVFSDAPAFAISVLSEGQCSLIENLKRPLEQRLTDIPIRDGLDGAPVLEDAAAVFECRTRSISRAGDHDVIMGEVERFESRPDAPLAYLSGRFGQIQVFA